MMRIIRISGPLRARKRFGKETYSLMDRFWDESEALAYAKKLIVTSHVVVAQSNKYYGVYVRAK